MFVLMEWCAGPVYTQIILGLETWLIIINHQWCVGPVMQAAFIYGTNRRLQETTTSPDEETSLSFR